MGSSMTDSSDNEGRGGRKGRRPAYLRGRSGALPRTEVQKPEEPDKDEPKQPETDDVIYSWQVWLFRRRPLVSVLVVVTVLGSLLLAYWAVPQPMFIAVLALVMLNRLGPYLFPLKYRLNERTVGFTTFFAKDIRNWSDLDRYGEFPDGVLLSRDPASVRGRLKGTLFLYYYEDGSNKDEILRVIRDKVVPLEARPKGDDDGTYKGGFKSALRRVRGARRSSKQPPDA